MRPEKPLPFIARPFVITVDFNQLNIRPGCRILDIGCGTGRHTTAAFQFKHITVIGADRNTDDLCEARNRIQLHERLGEHGDGQWGLAAADIAGLPFKNNAFDLVICSEVLEHIPEDDKAIREIGQLKLEYFNWDHPEPSILSWQDRFRFDVYYVDHLSFRMDLNIFFRTLMFVLTRQGIYPASGKPMDAFRGTS